MARALLIPCSLSRVYAAFIVCGKYSICLSMRTLDALSVSLSLSFCLSRVEVCCSLSARGLQCLQEGLYGEACK